MKKHSRQMQIHSAFYYLSSDTILGRLLNKGDIKYFAPEKEQIDPFKELLFSLMDKRLEALQRDVVSIPRSRQAYAETSKARWVFK